MKIQAVRIWRGPNRGRFGWAVILAPDVLYQSPGTFPKAELAEAAAKAFVASLATERT